MALVTLGMPSRVTSDTMESTGVMDGTIMAATINVHMTTKEGIATPMVTGMRPIAPAWRASASHAPPAMSRRAATKGLMCERDDWVPFGGAACLLLMIFLHTRLSWPHLSRSQAASPGWRDILIHVEQIARIIGCFDLCQSGVVVAVRRFHIVRALIHHHVDIAPARRIGMQCHPVVPGPLDHALVVGRVRIDTDDHLGEVGVTEAERGVARAGPMDGPVDRIEVHRRMHRR